MKKVGGRLLALVTMVVASIIFFLPSYQPLYKELPRWVREVLPDKGITLGLDLQGGIHLVLEVEEDRAVEIAVERTAAGLQDLLVEKKIPAESVKRTGSSQITIGFQNAELKAQVQKLLDEFPTYVENEGAGSGNKVVWELREAEIKRIKDSAINQALETIWNRIDQFGVAEPLFLFHPARGRPRGARGAPARAPRRGPPARAGRRAVARHQRRQIGKGPHQADRTARIQTAG